MVSAPDAGSDGPAAFTPAAGHRPARVLLPVVLILAAVLLTAAAIGIQVLRVRATASDLQVHARQTQRQFAEIATTEDPTSRARAGAALGQVRHDAHRLAGLTRSIPLGIAAGLPLIGEDVQAARGVAADTENLAAQLPALLDSLTEMRSSNRSGPLDLRPLTSREELLRTAAASAAAAADRTRAYQVRTPALADALEGVTRQLDELGRTMEPLITLAAVGAGMTGEQAPRRYLVVLQTPAESRATGGLVGGFVEVVVEGGRVQVLRQGSNSDLKGQTSDVVHLPGGFSETWGSFGAQRGWFVSNLSPDFPSVATVWAALYTKQFAVQVDGVVGVTPEALARLMEPLAPVALEDGTALTADNVVHLLERGVYEKFPDFNQESARNAYQQDVLRRLIDAVVLGPGVGLSNLRSISHAVDEGSLRLASTHPAEQAELADWTVAGSLPRGPGPFIAWTTQDASGTKLDVYLHRSLSLRRALLASGRERTTATAVLRNDAPTSGLPEYVTGRVTPVGTHELLLATYLSEGATVTSVTVDGQPVPPIVRNEAGHPVVIVQVPLAPGGGLASVVVESEQSADDRATRVFSQLVSNPDALDVPDQHSLLKRETAGADH